jgi:uncharacterized membrane protein
MSENPYDQPQTEVAPSDTGALNVIEPRGRPVGQGWGWISRAWSLFTPAWGQWILAFLLLAIIMMAIQFVPLIGGLAAPIISPVFTAGFLYMAHRAWKGEAVEIGDLFVAFREKTAPLIILGVISLVVTMVLMGIAAGVMFALVGDQAMSMMDMQAGGAASPAEIEAMGQNAGMGMIVSVLVMLALLIPWMAAYWFAVPLLFFTDRGVGAALKSSLLAVVRNILPMIWYGIIATVLSMIAAIPFFLGFLVLMPVLGITYYTMFRDIYTEDA